MKSFIINNLICLYFFLVVFCFWMCLKSWVRYCGCVWRLKKSCWYDLSFFFEFLFNVLRLNWFVDDMEELVRRFIEWFLKLCWCCIILFSVILFFIKSVILIFSWLMYCLSILFCWICCIIVLCIFLNLIFLLKLKLLLLRRWMKFLIVLIGGFLFVVKFL